MGWKVVREGNTDARRRFSDEGFWATGIRTWPGCSRSGRLKVAGAGGAASGRATGPVAKLIAGEGGGDPGQVASADVTVRMASSGLMGGPLINELCDAADELANPEAGRSL